MKQNQVCRFNKYFYRELYPNRYLELCRAIAINHDNTLIIAAAESNIKVIQIILPLLSQSEAYPATRTTQSIRQIEILKGKHSDFVSSLMFFKKTPSMRNSFISGSDDNTIIIWSPLNSFEFTIPSKWEVQCILKEHTNSITCLVLLTSSEDLIISGSQDKKIKFWSLTSTQPSLPWKCLQTIEEHTSTIFGLSINQEGTRLLSCASDFQILVMEGSNKTQWNIRQRISVDQWGYRLCFINNHVFTFQPIETAPQLQGSAHIHIYIYNTQKEQYLKSKTVLVQGGGQPCRPYFPQLYLNSINLLLSKNGHYLNFIRIKFSSSKSDLECNLEQAINFGTMNTYGTISDNGEFLVTWDQKQNNIQILVQGGQQET
ncbi:unnamed protein product [Paramecium pentaurelia]|uniref:Uncharacterized protein n=1 Tax=Paramecium pentaurelia TaxID=43138 RepID=A0A8S1SSU1_9CILI|nr:unnamed protein product [Paramecium pentaurelia]